MKPVGIFGGTFDPVHFGHLITAQAVKEIRNLEKIIFIPNYISPHKTDIKSSSAVHRLAMLNLAIKNISYFECSDIEAKDKEISYTVNTLKILKEKYEKLELIIGFDNIIKFDTWKNPDDILKLADLVVLERETNKKSFKKDKYFQSAFFVDTPTIEISSTEIRERVKQGRPINFLVPQSVKEYIYKFKLYKEGNK